MNKEQEADHMSEEQEDAIEELRYALARYEEAPSVGTRYALEMAKAACEILGCNKPPKGPSCGK